MTSKELKYKITFNNSLKSYRFDNILKFNIFLFPVQKISNDPDLLLRHTTK